MKAFFTVLAAISITCTRGQPGLNVYFDFDKSTLSRREQMRLDSLIATSTDRLATVKLSLDAYCDSVGTDHYNDKLSLSRAATVKEYLVRYGLHISNITQVVAHGEKNPINENRSKEERQLNRRVEIKTIDAALIEKSLTEKIADTATQAGTQIVLKNINFYGGSPFLLPGSFPVLDELIEVMRVNHSLSIEIQGHICCLPNDGDSPYGPTGNGLSEERAHTIYAELIGKGIDPRRVSYKGFGHSRPIYPYPEKSEEERIANRRVEIKVVSR